MLGNFINIRILTCQRDSTYQIPPHQQRVHSLIYLPYLLVNKKKRPLLDAYAISVHKRDRDTSCHRTAIPVRARQVHTIDIKINNRYYTLED